MSESKSEIDFLFDERKNFIVIGLTGKTGSGCTTVSRILNKSEFEEIELDKPKSNNYKNNDERKYRIIYEYTKENWNPFERIQVGAIISTFILDNDFENFKEFIKGKLEQDIGGFEKEFKEIKEKFNEIKNKYSEVKLEDDDIDKLEKESKEEVKIGKLKKLHKFYLDEVIKYTEKLKEDLNNIKQGLYTLVYQEIGNNLRKYGLAFKHESSSGEFSNVFTISKRINLVIKILREEAKLKDSDKGVLVTIDAFRNPYEAIYFKERYSAFYLFSVNSTQSDRDNRLEELDLTKTQIKNIDKKENAKTKDDSKDIFYNQNIEKCIEISDVYLYNPTDEFKTYKSISKQIIRYISLILHPGLVTPTNIERCMQIAYNAKVNSGCISRQVGALVTDEDYSIKSIGWNDVPHGQVPCNLKSINDFLNKQDVEAYSEYECTNKKLRKFVIEKWEGNKAENIKGRNIAYCFKDVYNGLKEDKNQVYTRSLHAEENAFLQISKYGGIRLKGGNLFTTASPCELCAKKAYQIGIKKIYYIDLYPGISESHILNNGNEKPELILFHGAIGRAYIQFYTPIIPYKDEMNKLTGVNFKEKAESQLIELKIAKNLLDILDDETIALKTGINIEKIKELRRLNK